MQSPKIYMLLDVYLEHGEIDAQLRFPVYGHVEKVIVIKR